MIVRAVVAALAVLQPSLLCADSWPGPQIREGFSANREHFVRIIPGRSLGDTQGFAGAQKGHYATAQFYRRAADRSYQLVAETTLLNPVAPVEFFVADNGHLATLDNWHNVGYGKIVAIYDARGQPIRAYELSELFDAKERARFPRSVSSVHWRKGPSYVREDQTTLLVTVREGADFLFGMETGGFEYCEPRDKSWRCRDHNAAQRWTHTHRRLNR